MTDRQLLSENSRADGFSVKRPKKGLSANEGNNRLENSKL